MTLLRYALLATGLAGVVVSVSFFTSLFAQQDVPAAPRPTAVSPEDLQPVPEDAVEIQTSGPVHEGFATPLTTEVPESIVVNKQPPSPIEELPPEQKPEGTNVVWIPGYFAWDDERQDFLWISGFWRDVPPGRLWVSGYWTDASDGYQWVPGFWTSAEQEEVEYLPQPPETVEAGPTIAQPSENHFWVPGHWQWIDQHYAWRPGYWSRIHPDWVWIPAHYVWCPNGYVFVNGYWDYPDVRRGVLFAPAYFQSVVYRRPYYFTPSIVWSTHLLTRHLWVRPSYYHYYFGDFYHDRYANWGIRPWYLSFTFGRVSYDPWFSYYRWRYRDRDWVAGVQDRYDFYRRNVDRRPPRTYRDMRQAIALGGNPDVIQNIAVAAPITQIVNRTTVNNVTANIVRANFDTPFRFDRVGQSERRQIARRSEELRGAVQQQRRKVETRDNIAGVEVGRREGAKAGADTRVRRPAPRGLNISEMAQAVGATPDQRGRGNTVRGRRDEQAAGRVADRERAKGAATVERDNATVGARGKGRGARDVARPEIAETDRDAARPGRRRDDAASTTAQPDLPELGSGRVGRGQGARARGRTAQPDLDPDVTGREAGPILRGPQLAPELGGDRGASARSRARDAAPQLDREPTRGLTSPRDQGALQERTLPADRIDRRGLPRDDSPRGRSDRVNVPFPRSGIDMPQPAVRPRRPLETGADRSIPRPDRRTAPGLGDPSALTRQPQSSARGPLTPANRERSTSPVAPRTSRGLADPSGMTRQPQGFGRENRPDRVAPLRLGGPQPAPRAAIQPRPEVRARPEVPRPSRSVERAVPRANVPSARIPSGDSQPTPRSESRSRSRGREKD